MQRYSYVLALFSETLTSTKLCNDSLSYIGNGFCDPWINYAECQFDGGDCCLNGDLGGFQLLDLIMTELKSHMTC